MKKIKKNFDFIKNKNKTEVFLTKYKLKLKSLIIKIFYKITIISDFLFKFKFFI